MIHAGQIEVVGILQDFRIARSFFGKIRPHNHVNLNRDGIDVRYTNCI